MPSIGQQTLLPDDWWHRIRVQMIKENKNAQKDIKIIKFMGKSTQQYPEDDDFFDDEYE